MVFNSFQFLWLFPLIFALVWLVRGGGNVLKHSKLQNHVLLLLSYGLYIQCKPIYALILLWVTVVTYGGALFLEKRKSFSKNKYYITLFVILSLLPLLVFKYYNFISDSISVLLSSFGWQTGLPGLNWAVPLGISFFSFQAVGYLFDVYYQRIKAEHNWWDYMLFVSFFPQIASGPISKAKDLLPQIKTDRIFDYDKAVQGCKWLLWGMFLKVVFADRLGMYVDTVYSAFVSQSGQTCFTAMFAYSLQIYADFAGYSLMAIGVGRLLGFDLINNFRRPYFAASVTEFWKRWHISLTKWLTDYVYIPLGGSRCTKPRTYLNIMIVFLVSGLWHGANWTFVVWGMLHGIFQVVEKALGIQRLQGSTLFRLPRIALTFMLVSVAWVFFRMPTLGDALGFFLHAFTHFNDIAFLSLSSDKTTYLAIGMVMFLFTEVTQEYWPDKFKFFDNKRPIIRYVSYLYMLLIIGMIGVLDSGNFIYFNF